MISSKTALLALLVPVLAVATPRHAPAQARVELGAAGSRSSGDVVRTRRPRFGHPRAAHPFTRRRTHPHHPDAFGRRPEPRLHHPGDLHRSRRRRHFRGPGRFPGAGIDIRAGELWIAVEWGKARFRRHPPARRWSGGRAGPYGYVSEAGLAAVLGERLLRRVRLHGHRLGTRRPLSGRWIRREGGGMLLRIRVGGSTLALLRDLDGDGSIDSVHLAGR